MIAGKFPLIILLLITRGNTSSEVRKTSFNRYEEVEEFDPIAVTRCDARCFGLGAAEKDQCHGSCLTEKASKPGSCPSSFDGLSVFAQACLKVCTFDTECPAVEKCCNHTCGVTCQPAENLRLLTQLPEVPVNVTAKELRGANIVQIQWTFSTSNPSNKGALFLIENQRHFGRFFNAESLGPWTPFIQANQSPVVVRGLVQTAHWYIFRVSAVNKNGTKGYSNPSQPFFLSKPPTKPRKPKRLRVINIRMENDTISANLRWGRPRSDVPIKRYKVFWSRRLPGYHPKNASDSVLVHQRNVPKASCQLQLRNLKKDELYYIQVQAMSVFGREKLKGQKAELFFNTTILHDQFSEKPRRRHQRHDNT